MKYLIGSVILILLLQFISCNNSTNPSDDNEQDIFGCTDPDADNYNPNATIDDGSCEYGTEDVFGCTDSNAANYNPNATIDDGSCDYIPAIVIGQETDSWYLGESAFMGYRLSNIGGTTAYNVQYRLQINYKCLTGSFSPNWKQQYLSYTYDGNIPAGKSKSFTELIELCSSLGILAFNFEISQILWD
ncbi:MAG: hypothetical protein V3U16_06370 [Candidatus Neomarinimicrobiota bacterium]